jgi:hypothetical protein
MTRASRAVRVISTVTFLPVQHSMPASLFQSYTHKKYIQRKGAKNAKFLNGSSKITIFSSGTILLVPGD